MSFRHIPNKSYIRNGFTAVCIRNYNSGFNWREVILILNEDRDLIFYRIEYYVENLTNVFYLYRLGAGDILSAKR